MAAGDVTPKWGSWNTMTQTNLDGLSSSSTFVIVWESAEIDTTGFLDIEVSATVVLESTGLSAGEVRMSFVAKHNSTAWPDVFDGTESTETISDTEIRDSILFFATGAVTDTDASGTYWLHCQSVKEVFRSSTGLPEKFVVVISQSSGNTLETTGDPNQVYWRGFYMNVAAS